jgi:hypothetical protein
MDLIAVIDFAAEVDLAGKPFCELGNLSHVFSLWVAKIHKTARLAAFMFD